MNGFFVITFLALATLANSKAMDDSMMGQNLFNHNNIHKDIPEDELRAPVLAPGEISPEELAGLYQGDIKLINGRNGIIDETKRWPNKTIPYFIEARYSRSDRSVIMMAMQEIMTKTCIKFVPYKSGTKDYIYILSRVQSGCSSYIGRIGGRQDVTLLSSTDGPRANCIYGGPGTAVHELTHAIGFYHMQSSYDRDTYVIIITENIQDGSQGNFDKESNTTVSYFGTSYDYSSIMHYGKTAFSKNGNDTITTLNPAFQDVIGQRMQMSTGDTMRIRNMYKC